MDHDPRPAPRRRHRTLVVVALSLLLLAGGVAFALPASAARPQCVWGNGGVTCASWTHADGWVLYKHSVTDDPDGWHSIAGLTFFYGDDALTEWFNVYDGHGSDFYQHYAPQGTTHMQLELCHYLASDWDVKECVVGQKFDLP